MKVPRALPRLLLAGLSGGSGKTLVSLGLLLSLRRAGVPVRAFKKGPDYIDTAWLAWASAQPARNLDTFLMGCEQERDINMALMLPCPIVVYTEGEETFISAMRPRALAEFSPDSGLGQIARQMETVVFQIVNEARV
jgi:cobyrinic acid a,c-diamide synthase